MGDHNLPEGYYLKTFGDLTARELYEILSLRQEVFIVEQNCPYLDTDDKDQAALHLWKINTDGKPVVYARLLPEGISYTGYTSLGRVVSSPTARRTRLGKEIMAVALAVLKREWPQWPVKISAQSYLLNFYSAFGFKAIGAPYLEDDIPHQAMILTWDTY